MFDPGAFSLAEYEREYYSGYPYQFWYHKARALNYFIEHADQLPYIRNENDIDTNDYIIENLKMEIHMILFHSAESLFLTVLGNYFYSAAPWLWMSSCDQYTTRDIMNVWKALGLDAIIKEPEGAEGWLRDTLYPNVIEPHSDYQRSKESAAFIKKFLDKMVTYYMNRNEYNAYKHGLRLFPGWESLTAINDATQNIEYISHGDVVIFLNPTKLKRKTSNGKNEEMYGCHIKRNSKRYDVTIDINRIIVITGIMQNILEEKRVQFKTKTWQKRQKSHNNRVYFDGFKVENYFSSGLSEISV